MTTASILRARIAIAVLVGLASAMANAQGTAPKLYRWVGADGKAHYSDQIPPEAIDNARQEISKTSGLTVGKVDRALTTEERAAAVAKGAADAKAAQVQEESQKNDQSLLASYPTEADLKRAYDERAGLQINTMKAMRTGIESQQQNLTSQLTRASNLELNGKPVKANLADSILLARKQLLDLQTLLGQHAAEIAALQSEYQSTLLHYRELQSAAAARAAAAPASGTVPNG